MKFYHSTFYSKNKKSLNNFFSRFFNETYTLKSKTIKKYFQKQSKIRKFAILKSPHVNKTAQEQFEIRKNLKQISVFQPHRLEYLYILKKIKNTALSDIRVKTKFSFNNEKTRKLNLTVLQPQNLSLSSKNHIINQKLLLKEFKKQKLKRFTQKINNRKINYFIKNLCAFGELKIINTSW